METRCLPTFARFFFNRRHWRPCAFSFLLFARSLAHSLLHPSIRNNNLSKLKNRRNRKTKTVHASATLLPQRDKKEQSRKSAAAVAASLHGRPLPTSHMPFPLMDNNENIGPASVHTCARCEWTGRFTIALASAFVDVRTAAKDRLAHRNVPFRRFKAHRACVRFHSVSRQVHIRPGVGDRRLRIKNWSLSNRGRN